MKKLIFFLAILSVAANAMAQVNEYDIIIDEIMADPSPAVGLPEQEFVELRNMSAHTVDLKGWKLSDGSSSATIPASVLLQPDSFVLLCSNAAAAQLSRFGTTIGMAGFPSLNNDADQIVLLSNTGRVIHAVAYSDTWYGNPVKRNGGWTLEMIDPHQACESQNNWTASFSASGGTPGKINSVDGTLAAVLPLHTLRAFALNDTMVLLQCNKPVDSLQAATVSCYVLVENSIAIKSAAAVPPLFNQVRLILSAPLAVQKVYRLATAGLHDCDGHLAGADTVKLGLSADAWHASLVLNEILYHPVTGGAEYIELFNRSDSIFNLKNCYLAARNGGGIGAPVAVSTIDYDLFPGEYILLSEDLASVAQQYIVKNPAALWQASIPALPNDGGDIVLLNAAGDIIDELAYDEHWQFRLLNNTAGVALERIDPDAPTQDSANWHSAATDARYGTPGYRNSQYRREAAAANAFSIDPPVFSPDNDGRDDFLTINYRFPSAGYTCNISLFDETGRPVRTLTHNALCGSGGYFRWDGLNNASVKLPTGRYILYAEAFNTNGQVVRYKTVVTLARK